MTYIPEGMTPPQETPTPPSSNAVTPASVWNSMSSKAKAITIGVVVVLLFAVIGSSGSNNSTTTTQPTVTVPATISVADQWSMWKSDFMPLVSTTQAHYTQTQTDLANADLSASLDDFSTLSNDATDWITYNNSPSPEVNRLVTAVSVDLQMIASQGVLVLTGDTSSSAISDFQSYCAAFGRDTDALANAIEKANNTY